MARTFRRQRQMHPIAELNVTNLIDLGFTLLIIFMIATPLIQQEQAIHVNLPIESRRVQDKDNKDVTFQSISINKAGEYYWGNRHIQPRELGVLLEEAAHKAKPPVINISADGTVPYQRVITLMDEVKKHNLSKISFHTQSPN
jgi:biopolymer transport protein TolR